MKLRKILVIALCCTLVTVGTAMFSACNNEQTAQGSKAPAERSQASEVSEQSEEEISEVSEEESSEAESSVDEDIAVMSETEKYISELTDSDEYKNADIAEKKKQALALLDELIGKGLIEKDSVVESDGMISFQYKGGILGGIMLKEFEPYMNNAPTQQSSEDSNTTDTSLTEPSVQPSENSLTIHTDIPDSDANAFGTKTYSDFTKDSTKSQDAPKGLFQRYFVDTFNKSEFHCELVIDVGVSEDEEPGIISMEYQKSGSNIYSRTVINRNDETSVVDYIQIIKNDMMYLLYPQENEVIVTENVEDGLSETATQITKLGTLMGTVKESGTCKYDGKDMYYELISDEKNAYTVAYFYNDKFYKAEVYQTSDVESDHYYLVGNIYGTFDIAVDKNLFEIPDGYTVVDIPSEIYDEPEEQSNIIPDA